MIEEAPRYLFKGEYGEEFYIEKEDGDILLKIDGDVVILSPAEAIDVGHVLINLGNTSLSPSYKETAPIPAALPRDEEVSMTPDEMLLKLFGTTRP